MKIKIFWQHCHGLQIATKAARMTVLAAATAIVLTAADFYSIGGPAALTWFFKSIYVPQIYGAKADGVTDDTVAVQGAITGCFNAGGGTVYAPVGTYLLNGAFDATTNSVLKIPDNTGGAPITIRIEGDTGVPNSPFGPGSNGTILRCTRTGTGTRPALFASRAYAAWTGLETNFSQVYPCFKNLNFRVPDDPTIDVLRFANAIDLEVDHCFIFPDSPVGSIAQPTHGTIGIYAPNVANHTRITIRESEVFGFATGIRCSEHTFFDNSVIVKCLTALVAERGNRPIYGHLTIESCPVILAGAGAADLTVVDLDINVERAPSGWYAGGASELNDSSNVVFGRIGYSLTLAGVGPSTGALTKNGGLNLYQQNIYSGAFRFNQVGIGLFPPTQALDVLGVSLFTNSGAGTAGRFYNTDPTTSSINSVAPVAKFVNTSQTANNWIPLKLNTQGTDSVETTAGIIAAKVTARGSSAVTSRFELYTNNNSSTPTLGFTLDETQNATVVGKVTGKALNSPAVAFASAVTSPAEGTLQSFSDSSTNTHGATITGGGANHVLGYYNGTNWVVAYP